MSSPYSTSSLFEEFVDTAAIEQSPLMTAQELGNQSPAKETVAASTEAAAPTAVGLSPVVPFTFNQDDCVAAEPGSFMDMLQNADYGSMTMDSVDPDLASYMEANPISDEEFAAMAKNQDFNAMGYTNEAAGWRPMGVAGNAPPVFNPMGYQKGTLVAPVAPMNQYPDPDSEQERAFPITAYTDGVAEQMRTQSMNQVALNHIGYPFKNPQLLNQAQQRNDSIDPRLLPQAQPGILQSIEVAQPMPRGQSESYYIPEEQRLHSSGAVIVGDAQPTLLLETLAKRNYRTKPGPKVGWKRKRVEDIDAPHEVVDVEEVASAARQPIPLPSRLRRTGYPQNPDQVIPAAKRARIAGPGAMINGRPITKADLDRYHLVIGFKPDQYKAYARPEALPYDMPPKATQPEASSSGKPSRKRRRTDNEPNSPVRRSARNKGKAPFYNIEHSDDDSSSVEEVSPRPSAAIAGPSIKPGHLHPTGPKLCDCKIPRCTHRLATPLYPMQLRFLIAMYVFANFGPAIVGRLATQCFAPQDPDFKPLDAESVHWQLERARKEVWGEQYWVGCEALKEGDRDGMSGKQRLEVFEWLKGVTTVHRKSSGESGWYERQAEASKRLAEAQRKAREAIERREEREREKRREEMRRKFA
jgi:hypothetical protein